MHWGHAISTNLVEWEHQPIALYPDSLGYIFSGSAVIDWNNTSGLQDGKHPPMIAIFTHHNMEGERAGTNTFQYQSIAFSKDKGKSWTKYQGNPVLNNPGIRDFRDPKVIWFEEGQKWIMVFAAHDRVLFYSSPNLIEWTRESEFGIGTGAHGGVWECPDLFPLNHKGETKWVLIVSLNPGGPNGGSGTQYFIGDFDGNRFLNENPGTEPLWLDYGKDNYAGVTWSDIPDSDGRRIFIGWMSNWQYATKVPTERWRSAMTIPRTLNLEENNGLLELQSMPVRELKTLRTDSLVLDPSVLSGINEIEEIRNFTDAQYEIRLTFKLSNGSQFGLASDIGFILGNSIGQKVVAGYNTADNYIYVDRKQSGKSEFSDMFAGIHTATMNQDPAELLTMHAFVDKASIELFVNQGARLMTEVFFPDEDFNQLRLFASNGNVKLESAIIYQLRSIW
jgi:fructan beta-fructosidase